MHRLFRLMIASLLSTLALSSISLAQNGREIVCDTSWEIQEKDFLEFKDPVIGFTVTDFSGRDLHWYLVEKEIMFVMNFKAYFVHDPELSQFVYIDGLEIGERFITPASEWIGIEFFDEVFWWPNMSIAFMDLTTFAPRCDIYQL